MLRALPTALPPAGALRPEARPQGVAARPQAKAPKAPDALRLSPRPQAEGVRALLAKPAPQAPQAHGLSDRTWGWLGDRLLGPEEPAFAGQIPGATGRVANRLGPGESAMLAATGTVSVPAAALAACFPQGMPLPDMGASVRMAGMLARRADGQLNLTLTFQSGQSASVGASSGLSTSVAWGDRRLGLKLGADVAAGAEVGQVVVATLRFDPKKPEDVQRLRDLMEPDVVGLLRPWAPELQAGTALQRAMQHNQRAIALGGSVGGNVGGTLGAAVGELDPSDGKGLAPDSPWSIKAKLGLLGSGSTEAYRTWGKDGGVADMVGLEGGLEASLKLVGWGRGKASDRQALAFNCGRDAKGQLTELSMVHTESQSQRALADLGALDVGLKRSGKVVVTRSLNEAGLAAAKALMAQGTTAFEAFRRLQARPELVHEERVASAGKQLVYGLQLQGRLLGQSMGFGGLLSMGQNQRNPQAKDDPGLRELLALLKGQMAQAPQGR